MKAFGMTLRAELVGAGGVVERNFYLTKRYIWWDLAWFFWTVANTLTIVFIAQGIEATGRSDRRQRRWRRALLIGAVVWAYLGVLFEFLMETVAWERWEGTIEYTFMAPLSRAMHLAGRVSLRSLRPSSSCLSVHCLLPVLRPLDAERELSCGVHRARDRLGLVHRDRRDDVGAAADLT